MTETRYKIFELREGLLKEPKAIPGRYGYLETIFDSYGYILKENAEKAISEGDNHKYYIILPVTRKLKNWEEEREKNMNEAYT